MKQVITQPKKQLQTKDEILEFAKMHERKIAHLWYMRYEGTANELMGMAAVIRLLAKKYGCTITRRLTPDEWHEIGTRY